MNVTAPAINVKENDKAYEVELAAPGTTKDDFKVNVDMDGCLTIKLEHKDEKKDENRGSSESHQACLNGRVASEEGKANKKEHYLRREFSYSNYEQALTLPDDVEKDKIEAKVNDGVLHITLPRTQKAERDKEDRGRLTGFGSALIHGGCSKGSPFLFFYRNVIPDPFW